MQFYSFGKPLGEGAFGSVRLAVDTRTGENVAIKTFKDKYKSLDELLKEPEVLALHSLKHPNIIECKEYLLEESSSRAHLVFELMDMGSLLSIVSKWRKPLTEFELRHIFHQSLRAIEHMHAQGFIHRDLKPENILLGSGDPIVVKVADLGLSRFLGHDNERPMTAYVATRWYRSPEILLRAEDYGPPSDLWALGAVMAELINLGKPLFPGKNAKDQLKRVIDLRGHPAAVNWEDGEHRMGVSWKIPLKLPVSLRHIIPNASAAMLKLIEDLLDINPLLRPTATEALCYDLFVQKLERPFSKRMYNAAFSNSSPRNWSGYCEDSSQGRHHRSNKRARHIEYENLSFYAPLETSNGLSDSGDTTSSDFTPFSGRAPLDIVPFKYRKQYPRLLHDSAVREKDGRPKWSPAGNFKVL